MIPRVGCVIGYPFTTDQEAKLSWVITMFAWRWAIEVLFRASKQVLDIESPQHWSQASVEKLGAVGVVDAERGGSCGT